MITVTNDDFKGDAKGVVPKGKYKIRAIGNMNVVGRTTNNGDFQMSLTIPLVAYEELDTGAKVDSSTFYHAMTVSGSLAAQEVGKSQLVKLLGALGLDNENAAAVIESIPANVPTQEALEAAGFKGLPINLTLSSGEPFQAKKRTFEGSVKVRSYTKKDGTAGESNQLSTPWASKGSEA